MKERNNYKMKKIMLVFGIICILSSLAIFSIAQGLDGLPIPDGAVVNGTGEGGIDDTSTTIKATTTTSLEATTTTSESTTTTTVTEENKPLGSLGGDLDPIMILIIVFIAIAIGGGIYLLIKRKSRGKVPKEEQDLIKYVQD
jgi:hypothetical protein